MVCRSPASVSCAYTARWYPQTSSQVVVLLATPPRRPAAGSVVERPKRNGPGSLVAVIGLCQLDELLGYESAE